MTTAKLKENLIQKINNTDNNSILEDVQRLLDFETSTEVYILSEEQKNEIQLALKDIENGDVISNEDANDFFDQWLKK